jgi:6,7-dimethyl-8-ribityllumazine synthase
VEVIPEAAETPAVAASRSTYRHLEYQGPGEIRWASFLLGPNGDSQKRYNRGAMAHEISGNLDGHGLRVGVIVSQFNEYLTARLLQGAKDALQQHGVSEENVSVVWVPGSLELAQAALRMARTGQWDALVTLGAVVKGETAHFEYVSAEAARGVADVARETGVPITFGVLTTYTIDQAMDRAGGKLGNRGRDVAEAAIKMATLFKELEAEQSGARSVPQEAK